MQDKRRAANAAYYQRTKDRIILRESELSPWAIEAIIDCLENLDMKRGGPDKRVPRLRDLLDRLT